MKISGAIYIPLDDDYDDIERAIVTVLNDRAKGKANAMNQREVADWANLLCKVLTNPRTIRDRIRHLRLNFLAPIASSSKGKAEGGYFVPQTEKELEEYREMVDKQGRHTMQLIGAIKKVKAKYFSQTDLLF